MKKPRKERRIQRRADRKEQRDGVRARPSGVFRTALERTADGWKQTITYSSFLQQRE